MRLIFKEHKGISYQKYEFPYCVYAIKEPLVYAKDHFLTDERLQYILSRPYLKQIMKIEHGDRVLAFLFPIMERPDMFHIWFNFYDTTIQQNDFGKWILLQTIQYAKRADFKHYYIGTCYGIKAFYKLTLSPHTTYFNGETWDLNVDKLKKSL